MSAVRKIGFYGMGNMGQAMLKGLVKAGYPVEDLLIYNRHGAVAEKLAAEYGVTAIQTPEDLAKASQVILFAVKPAILPGVLQALAPVLTKEQSLISVAAGISLGQMADLLSQEHKLFRVMPNTPALVGEGMSAVAHNEPVTSEEVQEVLGIFNSFGKAELVEEKLIDAWWESRALRRLMCTCLSRL
ncbi:pyrroline-5-carboxylate reductase family protein [Enterococcus asini]|uniref:pyrroline-5-carboxylate reductase family protein n=1 Tax=Enterococcus asini TaxID=57732 RepID=UPI00286F124B|nr:NAD(P)-binding domain-containing protein [Enterococcus asini]